MSYRYQTKLSPIATSTAPIITCFRLQPKLASLLLPVGLAALNQRYGKKTRPSRRLGPPAKIFPTTCQLDPNSTSSCLCQSLFGLHMSQPRQNFIRHPSSMTPPPPLQYATFVLLLTMEFVSVCKGSQLFREGLDYRVSFDTAMGNLCCKYSEVVVLWLPESRILTLLPEMLQRSNPYLGGVI